MDKKCNCNCEELVFKIGEQMLMIYGGNMTYKPTGEVFDLKQIREYIKNKFG